MVKAIQIQYDDFMEKMFEYAKSAGFTDIALGFGSSRVFHEAGWEKEVERIGELLIKYNLRCVQTHLPYYDLRISSEQVDPVFEEAIKRCISASAELGAKVCAEHLRSAYDYNFTRKRAYEDNRKAFSEYLEVAEKKEIILGFENLPTFPLVWKWRFYSVDYDDLIEIVDSFKSKYAKICWDFGHAHLTSINQEIALRDIGSRLACTHIHNNFEKDDNHCLPSMGTLDWEKTMPVLKEINYEGPLTLEVVYPYNKTAESFCKHGYQCLEYLEELMR